MSYELKVNSFIIKPATEPIFSEQATTVAVDDEAGGVFITISQDGGRVDDKHIAIDYTLEWPLICEAVERLAKEWKL